MLSACHYTAQENVLGDRSNRLEDARETQISFLLFCAEIQLAEAIPAATRYNVQLFSSVVSAHHRAIV